MFGKNYINEVTFTYLSDDRVNRIIDEMAQM